MSRILDFVKSLVPSIGRDRIVEDLDMTKGSIEQNVIPSWQAFAQYVKGTDGFTSTQGKAFERLVRILMKSNGNVGAAEQVVIHLEQLPVIAATVIKLVTKGFERDLITDGLTLDKVYVARLTVMLSFLDTAALRVLNFLSVAESGKDTVKELSKAGSKDAEDMIEEFLSKLEALTRLKPNELENFVKQLPDVVVSDTAEQSLAAMGDNKVDPLGIFKSDRRGFTGSPFHWAGMRMALGQVERYKANQELRKILALRLMDMKARNSGDPDPILQRQIDQTQTRIDQLDEKIRSFEEKTL